MPNQNIFIFRTFKIHLLYSHGSMVAVFQAGLPIFNFQELKFLKKASKKAFSTNENRASDVVPGLRSDFQPVPLLVRERVCHDFMPLKQGLDFIGTTSREHQSMYLWELHAPWTGLIPNFVPSDPCTSTATNFHTFRSEQWIQACVLRQEHCCALLWHT